MTNPVPDDVVIIPKADLPECKIVDRDGVPHVDCGADWGTWSVHNLKAMKTAALSEVAAWLAAEAWHSKAAVVARKRAKRRDELAQELLMDSDYAYVRAGEPLKLAIDKIIDLEKDAK